MLVSKTQRIGLLEQLLPPTPCILQMKTRSWKPHSMKKNLQGDLTHTTQAAKSRLLCAHRRGQPPSCDQQKILSAVNQLDRKLEAPPSPLLLHPKRLGWAVDLFGIRDPFAFAAVFVESNPQHSHIYIINMFMVQQSTETEPDWFSMSKFSKTA